MSGYGDTWSWLAEALGVCRLGVCIRIIVTHSFNFSLVLFSFSTILPFTIALLPQTNLMNRNFTLYNDMYFVLLNIISISLFQLSAFITIHFNERLYGPLFTIIYWQLVTIWIVEVVRGLVEYAIRVKGTCNIGDSASWRGLVIVATFQESGPRYGIFILPNGCNLFG